MSRLALVTGATGAIGPTLVEELLAAGWRVRVLVRVGYDRHAGNDAVELAAGDITDASAVERATRGADAVFHLAAKLHIENPGPELAPEYERVNVHGTRNVVIAARKHGARVVFFSTIAVYGYGEQCVITDETEPHPETLYAKTKLAAEELVLDAGGTVLRLGAVYGPRVKGNYRTLLDLLARGRWVNIGKGENRRTLVFERDVAAAALAVATHPKAAGRTYNVTDGASHTVAEIVAAISEALGRRPPRLRIPVWLARIAATLLRRRATLDKYLEEVIVTSARIQQEIGFTPKWSLREGWRETVSAEMLAERRRPGG
jgi:nucleoside-diphosphate-sugar epimerase